MKEKFVLANDIGGTHITSAIIDTSNRLLLEDSIVRHNVNSGREAKSIFLSWASAMKECIIRSGIKRISNIGIAMPGPFDYEEGISLMQGQNKYDALYNKNIKVELTELLGYGNIEIKFINDAAAFLQGEIFANRIDNRDCILGITLGTGLGSAVWKKHHKAFDASLWNTKYKEAIFEEYLVTRFLVKRFYELTGIKEIGFKEILEKHHNNRFFDMLMKEYCEHLSSFLSFFSEKYESESFIIGGNIAKAWNTITKEKTELFSSYQIMTGKHEEKAALIGAASLFF